MEIRITDWNIEKITWYKPKTTFYSDFSIADKFGLEAIKDTFERSFNEWKGNIEYVTELVMVLNWKCWEHYLRFKKELSQFCENHNEIGQWYKNKYYELLDWAEDNLIGSDLTYFTKH